MVEPVQEEKGGNLFDGLGYRLIAVVQEVGKATGDTGMVKAAVYDGTRKVKASSFGEDGVTSSIGRQLLGLVVGQRVEIVGSLQEDPKYGPEIIVRSLARA